MAKVNFLNQAESSCLNFMIMHIRKPENEVMEVMEGKILDKI